MLESEIIYGLFKEEIKNRFLCTVNINGINNICYIPSSCRLSNFIELSNRIVMLRPIKNKNSKIKYSVYAVNYKQCYVPLNLSIGSRIVGENIGKKYFSFLGKRKKVFREKTIDKYKSDLYIADTNTIIEIKSILSFDKTAMFPTVFSERAIRQLKDILVLLANGYKVCYVFVAMYSGVEKVYVNKAQEEYYKLFNDCVNAGMMVSAISLGMKESMIYVKARVDVVLY